MNNNSSSLDTYIEDDKTKKPHLLVVGFGSVVSWKYMRFIEDYIWKNVIDGYSMIDIESQREVIKSKIKNILVQPKNKFYLTNWNTWKDIENIDEFVNIVNIFKKNNKDLKVFISTDPRYHEWYLEYCLENNIDCLVEKPIITPMTWKKFNPSLYKKKMENLFKLANSKEWNFSVMSWARYHEIFNWGIIDKLEEKMKVHNTPITSFHLRTSSWVWNLYNEFIEREDHPYKYWFWVLNHWAYHYIDIFAQCLELNKKLLSEELKLTISSFAAYPIDQSVRISEKVHDQLDWGWDKNFWKTDELENYGETDIVTNFSLTDSNWKVVTLWTLSLEHTTPSCRNWSDLDYDEYNKNWRLPCTDIEVQLSSLYSVHAHMFKKPENFLQYNVEVLYRSNIEITNDDQYYKREVYPDFESKWKYKLIKKWLEWNEEKSKFTQHSLTMKILEELSISIKKPGESISFNI